MNEPDRHSAVPPTYAVVTPVRDEAEHFCRTADSLVAQTYRPREWIVVDDGSLDGTRELAEAYAAAHEWIRVISSENQHHRRGRGAPIVRAFEAGRAQLAARPEVVVKLDGDIFLPPHYFAWVAATFARVPRAGIVGGVSFVHDGRRWVEDGAPDNVNGVAKAYRSDCLDDIGGLRASMGWDGIDEYAARARGWGVHVLTELSILHYQRPGSKQRWHRARWEEGRGNHYMGYTWSWLLVRAAYRMATQRPRGVGGLVLLLAFVWAHALRYPQVEDVAARDELRREQRARLRRLLRGTRAVPAPALPDGGPAFWASQWEDVAASVGRPAPPA